MAAIKLLAGGVSAWSSALSFTAGAFNSLADGHFVLLTALIDNSSNLDLMCEIEGEAVVGGTTVARSHMAVFLLPERSDGTTYGDDTATGANPPNSSYWAATLGARVGVTTGNTARMITPRPFLLTRGVHKIGIQNKLTVALNATPAAAFKIRTTNLQTI
jgi:hypothetical protein